MLVPEGEPRAGEPVLDDDGNVAMPDVPKIRADLRKEFTKEQIDQVRQGLWEVVNDPGGTGAKARLKNVIVAGKTGSAQATDRGKKDTIAWFCCFAPFDHPRYVICTMVQGGKHGGSVAAPIAAHIMEQCLAMDQGSYKVELTKLTRAHSAHPFTSDRNSSRLQKPGAVTVQQEEEETADSQPAAHSKVQMGDNDSHNAARPDVRPSADARGRVPQVVQAAKPDRRSLLERFFGRRPAPDPAPAPASRRPAATVHRSNH